MPRLSRSVGERKIVEGKNVCGACGNPSKHKKSCIYGKSNKQVETSTPMAQLTTSTHQMVNFPYMNFPTLPYVMNVNLTAAAGKSNDQKNQFRREEQKRLLMAQENKIVEQKMDMKLTPTKTLSAPVALLPAPMPRTNPNQKKLVPKLPVAAKPLAPKPVAPKLAPKKLVPKPVPPPKKLAPMPSVPRTGTTLSKKLAPKAVVPALSSINGDTASNSTAKSDRVVLRKRKRPSRSIGGRKILDGANVCVSCENPKKHKVDCPYNRKCKETVMEKLGYHSPKQEMLFDQEERIIMEENDSVVDVNEPTTGDNCLSLEYQEFLQQIWTEKKKYLPPLYDFKPIKGKNLDRNIWPDWLFRTPNYLLPSTLHARQNENYLTFPPTNVYVICPHTFFQDAMANFETKCPACNQSGVQLNGWSKCFRACIGISGFDLIKSRSFLHRNCPMTSSGKGNTSFSTLNAHFIESLPEIVRKQYHFRVLKKTIVSMELLQFLKVTKLLSSTKTAASIHCSLQYSNYFSTLRMFLKEIGCIDDNNKLTSCSTVPNLALPEFDSQSWPGRALSEKTIGRLSKYDLEFQEFVQPIENNTETDFFWKLLSIILCDSKLIIDQKQLSRINFRSMAMRWNKEICDAVTDGRTAINLQLNGISKSYPLIDFTFKDPCCLREYAKRCVLPSGEPIVVDSRNSDSSSLVKGKFSLIRHDKSDD